jgi:hypothetical protein
VTTHAPMVADYDPRMSESRSLGSRIAREPLVGFVVLGALLFVVDRVRAPETDAAHRIVVDAPFVEGLRTDAARRTGHEPDRAETEALVASWVREEALYREARAMTLDEGDIIVRHRLVQKIELVLAAEAAPDEPTDTELAAYLAAHADRWTAPARTSVSLCFFSRELRSEARAAALARLADASLPCDPHLSGEQFRERTDAQLAAIVGRDAVAALPEAELDAWGGPFETPRGFYLVRVDARSAGGARALDEVADEVRQAMREERRVASVSAREAEITAQYEVVRL